MPQAHFFHGARHEVSTFVSGAGRDGVRGYLDGMQKPDRAKMLALLHRAGDHGPPFNNPERCRMLKGEELNEFKTSGHRITWVFVGDRILLLTAFSKNQNSTPPQELERARGALASVRAERHGGNP